MMDGNEEDGMKLSMHRIFFNIASNVHEANRLFSILLNKLLCK